MEKLWFSYFGAQRPDEDIQSALVGVGAHAPTGFNQHIAGYNRSGAAEQYLHQSEFGARKTGDTIAALQLMSGRVQRQILNAVDSGDGGDVRGGQADGATDRRSAPG